MTVENFDATLVQLYDMRPFQVFTIELHNGRRFEVDNPRALSLRNGLAVFISPGGLPITFDHESVSHIFPATANTII